MNEQKSALRKYIRQQKMLYSAVASEQSARIMERLESDEDFVNAHTILLYASLEDEVDTHDLIARHEKDKCILLPIVVGDTLELRIYNGHWEQGAFGIMEPTGSKFDALEQIDIAIIPGIAFDREGHRLGRGKGYYDKLLPSLPHCKKIGVCFPFQLVDQVPTDLHDITMDKVITL